MPPPDKEYAFEVKSNSSANQNPTKLIQTSIMWVAASSLRFGAGVTSEVGFDFKNMKARKVRAMCEPARVHI